jgi:hypothetical protein
MYLACTEYFLSLLSFWRRGVLSNWIGGFKPVLSIVGWLDRSVQ